MLLFAAGYLSFIGAPQKFHGVSFPIVVGLAFVIGILPLAPLLCLIIPSWRFSCETSALGVFLITLIGAFNPMLGLTSVVFADGPGFWIFLFGITIIGQLCCSPMVDRSARKRHWTGYSVTTRLEPSALWDGLIGEPTRGDRYVDRDMMIAFEHLEAGRPDRRLIYRINPGGRLEEHHFIDEINEPHQIRFRWKAVDGTEDQPFAEGEKHIAITDCGRKRVVRVTQQPRAHPWRAVVINWIDDSFGRPGDDRVAGLERRMNDGSFSSP
ncbi:hypothetical protein [Marimonas arenosa]|uniref:Uncharacterized protein n=1 Tax=Marimonas arenosa TaxID=1795305 RepID=A0AAE4B359_9RHOB|nr:hypothetical protein [Marimonas arenosa]MDQ2089703.1 hypothetical protein [Marimonas arenosa]